MNYIEYGGGSCCERQFTESEFAALTSRGIIIPPQNYWY